MNLKEYVNSLTFLIYRDFFAASLLTASLLLLLLYVSQETPIDAKLEREI